MSESPWRTVKEAAARMRLSEKTVYKLAASGQLRASRATGRKALRFLDEWCDEYLMRMAEPVGKNAVELVALSDRLPAR